MSDSIQLIHVGLTNGNTVVEVTLTHKRLLNLTTDVNMADFIQKSQRDDCRPPDDVVKS